MPLPTLGTLAAPVGNPSPAGASTPDPAQDPTQAGAAADPSQLAAAASPATTPQPASGDDALAKAHVSIALSLLNNALSKFSPGSESHKVVMEATRRLAKHFASGSSDKLAQTETQLLQSQANQSGAAQLQ